MAIFMRMLILLEERRGNLWRYAPGPSSRGGLFQSIRQRTMRRQSFKLR